MKLRPVEGLQKYCTTFRMLRAKWNFGRESLLIWLVFAVVDCVLGCLCLSLLHHLQIHERIWPWVDARVVDLDDLIQFLTQNPVGLKLNEPLNRFLARFFRYHIYLWQTFMLLLRGGLLWKILLTSLPIGVTLGASVTADIFALLTVHIRCFEVYINSSKNVFVEEMEETQSLLNTDASDYGGTCSLTESVLEGVEPVTLAWQNIQVEVTKGGRSLLKDVSGMAKPGQLMALMGASGAGKTTLLNTLLQRNLKGLTVHGKVLVNGNEIGRGITAISGYAQQEELFVGTLTVKEYLTIQARLRLNITEERRARRVNIVMRQLGLFKCQHTRIGIMGVKKGISGGEARRLTFACELLSNPAVLFCDEPTTGLDSFMAESVVQVLSRLAHSGRTILCTIHQPASQLYALFDSVLCLAGGQTAFLGSPTASIQFFGSAGYPCPHNYNPADLIIHTLAVIPNEEKVCVERIEAICGHFQASTVGQNLQAELDGIKPETVPAGRQQAPFHVQFSALIHRAVIDNWRNPSLFRSKMLQKVIMGLFIGLLYLQTPLTTVGITNINGALFYLVCELTYATLFGIITFLPEEYPLVVREYHDGLYSICAYFFSKSLSYVPLFALDGLTMVLISYWMIGLSSSLTQVLLALFICLLIEQSSSAFGVMLSTVSPSYAVAVSLGGPILTLLSLTGGLYANVGALPAYISWIQYLSWFRYGFEALAVNQWTSVNGLNATEWGVQERDGVLSSYSFSASNLWLDQLYMAGFIVLFYTVGYLGLMIRVKRSR